MRAPQLVAPQFLSRSDIRRRLDVADRNLIAQPAAANKNHPIRFELVENQLSSIGLNRAALCVSARPVESETEMWRDLLVCLRAIHRVSTWWRQCCFAFACSPRTRSSAFLLLLATLPPHKSKCLVGAVFVKVALVAVGFATSRWRQVIEFVCISRRRHCDAVVVFVGEPCAASSAAAESSGGGGGACCLIVPTSESGLLSKLRLRATQSQQPVALHLRHCRLGGASLKFAPPEVVVCVSVCAGEQSDAVRLV